MNEAKFISAVFFVKDIKEAKHFYANILKQKIVNDFGRNVGFEGGLSIWDEEYALQTIYNKNWKNIIVGENKAEIYFEVDNIERFYENLVNLGVDIIHPILEHPWGQKGFRALDPDNHILEFSESMEDVVLRLAQEGMTKKQICEKSMMPIEFINLVMDKMTRK